MIEYPLYTFSVILESSFTSLGCWKDNSIRSIDGYEGVKGIQGCFERAKALGYDVFAVQYRGQCFTTATAGETYKKYGPSNGCSASGTGGAWANEVYKIHKIGKNSSNFICGNSLCFI